MRQMLDLAIRDGVIQKNPIGGQAPALFYLQWQKASPSPHRRP